MQLAVAPWVIDRDADLKKRFALSILREPAKLYEACLELSDGNISLAIQRNMAWPNDPVVKAEKEKLLAEHGEEYFLPSRAKIAMDLYLWAHEKTDSGQYRLTGKERIDALAAHSKIRGFDNESTPGSGNVQNHVKVVFVSANADQVPSSVDAKIIENDNASTNPVNPFPQLRFAK